MSEKNAHHNNSRENSRERLKESLSVSLDGQANELELRRVLEGVSKDAELRATAGRYQLVGDALRGGVNQYASVDISAGVMAAIEQDDINEALNHASRVGDQHRQNPSSGWVFAGHWWSSLGRVAMAASVAFAMVMGVRSINAPQDMPALAVDETGTLSQPVQLASGLPNSYGASGIRAGYNSRQHDSITPEQLAYAQSLADQATQERFRAYALQHAELSYINHGQGILSFARLTSFDSQ